MTIEIAVHLAVFILYIFSVRTIKPRIDSYTKRKFPELKMSDAVATIDKFIFLVLLLFPLIGLIYVCLYLMLFAVAVILHDMVTMTEA